MSSREVVGMVFWKSTHLEVADGLQHIRRGTLYSAWPTVTDDTFCVLREATKKKQRGRYELEVEYSEAGDGVAERIAKTDSLLAIASSGFCELQKQEKRFYLRKEP